ncbi:hypothetical protein [Streptomyces sp. HUAS ZL42]|uniref:hypothetical protein n=1 Tax=Streptomyces sp. HUAS ZL42 TaxID=3231715 RepID=UPI00345E8584
MQTMMPDLATTAHVSRKVEQVPACGLGGRQHVDPDDPDFSHRVDVTLLPKATDALYRNPVGRDDLRLGQGCPAPAGAPAEAPGAPAGAPGTWLGQVRSVQKVKPEALRVLLARAGLWDG